MYTKTCEYCGKEFTTDKKRQMCCSYFCARNNRLDDLVGKKFGRLTVLKRLGSNFSQSRTWECLCDCGKSTIVTTNLLNNGHVKSCGCLDRELSSERFSKEMGLASFNALYCNYKGKAKRRQEDFDISEEDFKRLTQQNCHYCGIEPMNGNYKSDRRNGKYIYNGLDRIDSDKGYTIDNVVPCCSQCNKMKGAYTQEAFLEKVKRIYGFLKM